MKHITILRYFLNKYYSCSKNEKFLKTNKKKALYTYFLIHLLIQSPSGVR